MCVYSEVVCASVVVLLIWFLDKKKGLTIIIFSHPPKGGGPPRQSLFRGLFCLLLQVPGSLISALTIVLLWSNQAFKTRRN